MAPGKTATNAFGCRSPLRRYAGCALVAALGCATEANTLEPAPDEGTSGSSSSAGTKATSGGTSNHAGSGPSNAFGGAQSSGGKPAGTAGSPEGEGGALDEPTSGASNSAGAGGKSTAGAGGKAMGGVGGIGGTSASGGQGGSAQGGSAGSGSVACLNGWQGDQPCDTCSTQTQSDKLACVDILNCFIANSCGPATCTGNDDKCGANKIGKGTAGFPIASQVYDCRCK